MENPSSPPSSRSPPPKKPSVSHEDVRACYTRVHTTVVACTKGWAECSRLFSVSLVGGRRAGERGARGSGNGGILSSTKADTEMASLDVNASPRVLAPFCSKLTTRWFVSRDKGTTTARGAHKNPSRARIQTQNEDRADSAPAKGAVVELEH